MITVQQHEEWQEGREGFFLLPENVYRKAIGVSQSDIKLACDDADLIRQSRRRPRADTRFMLLGKIVHAGCLEPDTYGLDVSHYVEPKEYEDEKTKLLKPWSNNSNVCRKWHEDHKDKPILTDDEWESVQRMVQAFTEHDEGKFMLKNAYKEVAVFHRDEESGLMWKGRFDLLLLHPAEIRIGDIKTCGKGGAEDFGESAAEYGYHIQSAFYRELVARAVSKATGEHKINVWDRTSFINITIESGGSQFVRWLTLDHTALNMGSQEYEAGLRRIELAMNTGRWSRVQTTSLPKWKIQKLQQYTE